MAPNNAKEIAEVLLKWSEDHPTLPPFARHAVLDDNMQEIIDGHQAA